MAIPMLNGGLRALTQTRIDVEASCLEPGAMPRQLVRIIEGPA